MSSLACSPASALSYPAEVVRSVETLKSQGFSIRAVTYETFPPGYAEQPKCAGQKAWKITCPAKESWRSDYHVWIFADGILDSGEAVEVAVEVC